MATSQKPPAPVVVKDEPEALPAAVPEPAEVDVEAAPERLYDHRKSVYAYDSTTGAKIPHPVPETWLRDFPNLRETPSMKEGS